MEGVQKEVLEEIDLEEEENLEEGKEEVIQDIEVEDNHQEEPLLEEEEQLLDQEFKVILIKLPYRFYDYVFYIYYIKIFILFNLCVYTFFF